MFRISLLFAFICTLQFVAFAQNRLSGTIIFKSGDTLNGFILTSARYTNSEKVSYTRYIASKEVKSYSPAEVKSFYSEQGYFQSIKNSAGSAVFMKRMSYGGPAALFSVIDQKGYPTFFVLLDSVFTMLHRQGLNNQLKSVLKDCQTLTFTNPYYEEYFLQDLISRYNACVNPEKAVYAKRKRPLIGTAGFKAGPSYNSIEYGKASFNSVGFSSGFFLDLSVVEPLSFQLEVNYLKRGGKNEGVNVKGNYVQFPIMLKLKFPIKPQAPDIKVYLSGGLSYNYALGSEVRSQTGSLVSLGVAKDYQYGKAIYVDLRYDLMNRQTGFSSGVRVVISTIHLSTGITF